MKKAVYQLETLTCPSCIKKIEGVLNKEAGVAEVKVLFNSSKVRVLFDDSMTSVNGLGAVIQKLGYPVLSTKSS